MNAIYCTRNENHTLDFYVTSRNGDCYLFTNKNYSSVYERYKKPVRIEDAKSFGKAPTEPLKRVAKKIPMYLRYVEMCGYYIPERKVKRKLHDRYARSSIICEEYTS